MWSVYYYQQRSGGDPFMALRWGAGTLYCTEYRVTLPDGTQTMMCHGDWALWDSEIGAYKIWSPEKFHRCFQESFGFGVKRTWRPWEILTNT